MANGRLSKARARARGVVVSRAFGAGVPHTNFGGSKGAAQVHGARLGNLGRLAPQRRNRALADKFEDGYLERVRIARHDFLGPPSCHSPPSRQPATRGPVALPFALSLRGNAPADGAIRRRLRLSARQWSCATHWLAVGRRVEYELRLRGIRGATSLSPCLF